VQGEGGLHAAPVAAFAPLVRFELFRIVSNCFESFRIPTHAVGHALQVVAVCQQRELLNNHATLRGSAVLALCKLMAVDAAFCEAQLQVRVR
jgi:hypothetical protein